MASIRKARKEIGPNAQFAYLLDHLMKPRSKQERIASLIRAGILTPEGDLADKYK